jgi:pyroglutamyl-peptidase
MPMAPGAADPHILVTGFEPFGGDSVNPSQEIAKRLDGGRVGDHRIRGLVLPVAHERARELITSALAEAEPAAVLHVGLAARARIALEQVAVNVMDYAIADNLGQRFSGQPCVPGGPVAYASTLPLRAILAELTAEGIPAYLSYTAGTYLCNQTMYSTLHAIAARPRQIRAGFIHVPLLPAMVVARGLDQPSMDLSLMLRAVETSLRVIAST